MLAPTLFGICSLYKPQELQHIHWAAYALTSSVEHVCVYHSRTHTLVSEQLLDRPDVVARFEQVRGERVPECVAAYVFRYPGPSHRLLHGSLQDRLVDVMPPLLAGLRVLPPLLLWEDPLPLPLNWSIGVLAIQRIGQLDTTPTFGKILLVDDSGSSELSSQRVLERCGQHGDPVLVSLAVSNCDLVSGEVDVLDPQAQTLHKP